MIKQILKHTSSILCMLLTIALLSMIVLSTPVLAAGTNGFGTVTAMGGAGRSIPFKDVPSNTWYYDNVCDAYAMGLINGKTATSFAPDDNMTVAEAVKLAACMNQLNRDGSVTLKNGSVWYKPYFEYCYANGIIAREDNNEEYGYYACLDRANFKISREEYALYFSRALPDEQLPEVNMIPDDSIPDVPTTNSVYNNAIYKLYRSGIVNGSDDYGSFNPGKNITRCEVATILVRMMDASTRVAAPYYIKYEPEYNYSDEYDEYWNDYGEGDYDHEAVGDDAGYVLGTVLDWYEAVYEYRPGCAEVDSVLDNGLYVIHLYDDMGGHLSTAGWYAVDPYTLQGYDYMTGAPIDFSDTSGAVG